jgi:methylated-DNA-[protein]-cysteine S-methyltransferase
MKAIHNMQKSLEVLKLLKNVPKGKVTTYGALAKAAHTSPRAVGQIMKRNLRPDIYQCYKVVSSSGKIHGYAGCLSGKNPRKKMLLLKNDGIEIKKGKINLKIYEYSFKRHEKRA